MVVRVHRNSATEDPTMRGQFHGSPQPAPKMVVGENDVLVDTQGNIAHRRRDVIRLGQRPQEIPPQAVERVEFHEEGPPSALLGGD